MRGIRATTYVTIIVELIIGHIAMCLDWKIETLALVLGVIVVGFWGAGIALVVWANKGRM